jgi:hypothetical protein
MSKETAQSEQSETQTGSESQPSTTTTEEIVVTKSAEELAKRLKEVSAEAKTYRQRLAQEKSDRENEQKKTLEEQGQFKELANVYKTKAESAEAQAHKLRAAFATKIVADAVAIDAVRLGCVDPDALLQLMPLDQIPIGDGFEVDKNHVRTMVEDFKKGKPYLFQKQSPRVPDGTPGKAPVVTGKPLEKMTAQEIEQLILSQHKKG